VTLVTFQGSVGSGKTTTARALTAILRSRSIISYYVDIAVFHGFAYFVIATISHIVQKLGGYRYVGNHYLTLWFNNKSLLRKVYRISLLLDIPSLIIAVMIRVYLKILLCTLLRRCCTILVDEGPLTAMAIHYYFSRQFNTIRLFKHYYRIAYALLFESTKSQKSFFIMLEQPLRSSIKAWIRREKTNLVDFNMISTRLAFENILLNYLSESSGILVLRLKVASIGSVVAEVTRRILTMNTCCANP